MRVSPSQLRTWKDCPQEWHYSYVDGLRLKKQSRYFDIGSYTHELFHVLYQYFKAFPNAKPGSDEVIEMMRHRINQDMDEMDLDNIDIMSVVWPLVQKYVSYQSPRIDVGIEIIGVEREFKVNIGEGLVLHGFIDLVYRDRAGRIRVRDHKTGAQANSWSAQKVKMDEQLLSYSLGMEIELGEPVHDVEINFALTAQTKKPKPNSEVFQLYRHTHNENVMRVFRENLLTMYRSMVNDLPYRNLSSRCGSCRFHSLCYLEMRGMDTEPTLKAMYQQIERDIDNG